MSRHLEDPLSLAVIYHQTLHAPTTISSMLNHYSIALLKPYLTPTTMPSHIVFIEAL